MSTFPNEYFEFAIVPQNQEFETVNFVNNALFLARYQMQPIIDFNIHEGSPVRLVHKFLNWYGFNNDNTHFPNT